MQIIKIVTLLASLIVLVLTVLIFSKVTDKGSCKQSYTVTDNSDLDSYSYSIKTGQSTLLSGSWNQGQGPMFIAHFEDENGVCMEVPFQQKRCIQTNKQPFTIDIQENNLPRENINCQWNSTSNNYQCSR